SIHANGSANSKSDQAQASKSDTTRNPVTNKSNTDTRSSPSLTINNNNSVHHANKTPVTKYATKTPVTKYANTPINKFTPPKHSANTPASVFGYSDSLSANEMIQAYNKMLMNRVSQASSIQRQESVKRKREPLKKKDTENNKRR